MASITQTSRRLTKGRSLQRRLSSKAPIRHLDFSLFTVPLALGAIGCLAIYSATQARLRLVDEDPHYYLKRQIVFLAVAFILFLASLLFDYRQLRGLAPILYGAGVLMLLVVLSPLGERVAGAQRWIGLGSFKLQPSEFMKVIAIIALAAFYAEERNEPGPRRMGIALAIIAVPSLLIFLQPDLGTMMVLTAILFAVLLISGTQFRWLAALLLGGLLAFILALQLDVLKEYQVARLIAFLDTNTDAQTAGYNLTQSKIAIGAGGLMGKGLLGGTQTNLDYVPENHTDFVFTAIGEEMGFLGGIILMALFAILLWRTLRIAMLSKDLFGTLLAGGIAGMFIFQIFVNIGMTVGIMPITGIPLPFVSYGGSSLLTNFLAIGILVNIHMRRFI